MQKTKLFPHLHDAYLTYPSHWLPGLSLLYALLFCPPVAAQSSDVFSGSAGYLFDSIVIDSSVDREPPVPQKAVYDAAQRSITVSFSEPLDPRSVTRNAFRISDAVGLPASVSFEERPPEVVRLFLHRLLSDGEYLVTTPGVWDLSGNLAPYGASVSFTVRSDTIAPGPLPMPRDLIVNEIFYDPPVSELEFIELYNRSDHAVDLRTLRVSDSRNHPVSVRSRSPLLAPAQYAVLVRDTAAFADRFPGVPVHMLDSWPTLNNGGDAVVLSAGGQTIDSVAYQPSWGSADVSLERVDPAGPSNYPLNWRPSTAAGGTTPGAINSVFHPDTTAPYPIFAEQIAERRVVIYFSEVLDTITIAPGGFRCGQNVTTEAVQVFSKKQIELLLSEPPGMGECTVEGIADRTGNRLSKTAVPLAYLPHTGDLLINEIMYEPAADPYDNRPDQPEYIELYNRSGRLLTLHDLYWTDRPDESGSADTLHVGQRLTALPPGGFAVIYADSEAGSNPLSHSKLLQAFPAIDPAAGNIRLLPIEKTSLGLLNGGETVRLHNAQHHVIEWINYKPDWHHPALADARGIALERISLMGRSNDSKNWSSSAAPAGGTPGRPNSVYAGPAVKNSKPGVTISPSPFSPDGDGHEDAAIIQYNLSSPTASLRVRIFDARGRLVRTLTEARLTGQTGTLIWDGRDDERHPLPIGIYVVLFEAVDSSGGTVETYKVPVVLARQL